MISSIFFRFWRFLSLPFLVVVFLFCYISLPEMIAVQHTESGRPNSFMDKQTFFYTIFGVTIAFNLLMGLLKNQLLKVNFSKLVPHSIWAANKTALNALLVGWFDAFIGFVNTYIGLMLIGLNRVNSNEEQRLDLNYNWFLLGGLVVLLVILFFLPLRILFTNPTKED